MNVKRLPEAKVTAAIAGAAAADVIVWLIEQIAKTEVDFGVESSITILFVAAFGYLAPNRNLSTSTVDQATKDQHDARRTPGH